MRKYLFSDESGDLVCRNNNSASRYFAVGTLFLDEQELHSMRTALLRLRDELAWETHGLDSTFHATTDSQNVRDRVFAALAPLNYRFDITILEKRKAAPRIAADEHRLFKYAWYYHLRYIASAMFMHGDEVLVVAAQIGTKKKRQTFREAIEDVMSQCMPFRIKKILAFWRDESDFALQAVDYLTWAVMRKWEKGDSRSYDLVKHRIRTEYDLFAPGTQYYY